MKDEYIPEVVSINQLCKLMGISRSRYYQLLSDGFILPPIYTIDNKRPYYTREMAQINVSVVQNNRGLNGQICLFYNTNRRTGASQPVSVKNHRPKQKSAPKSEHMYQDLIEGLSLLGISDVKPSQVESVVKKLYPNGIQNQDEGEVLKSVYRVIVKQNSTDNPDR